MSEIIVQYQTKKGINRNLSFNAWKILVMPCDDGKTYCRVEVALHEFKGIMKKLKNAGVPCWERSDSICGIKLDITNNWIEIW